MILCTCCKLRKGPGDFEYQKRDTTKLYAWCNSCRTGGKVNERSFNKTAYVKEVIAMRSKAKELRKFSPEQCTELKKRYESGEKVASLAIEKKASANAVYKAIKGYK